MALLAVDMDGRRYPTLPAAAAMLATGKTLDELAPKLRAKGYRGKLITPLPVPREL